MRTATTETDAKTRASAEASRSSNPLASDFKGLVNDAEELLRTTREYTGEGFAAARTKFEERLKELRTRMPEAQSFLAAKYKQAAANTDRYVRDYPWQAIGAAAVVGLLVGFLSARR